MKISKQWQPWVMLVCDAPKSGSVYWALNQCTGKYKKYRKLVALALSVAAWIRVSEEGRILGIHYDCGLCHNSEDWECTECILSLIGQKCSEDFSLFRRWTKAKRGSPEAFRLAHKLRDVLMYLYKEEYAKVFK